MQYFDGFIWWKHFFPGKKFNQIQKVRGRQGESERQIEAGRKHVSRRRAVAENLRAKCSGPHRNIYKLSTYIISLTARPSRRPNDRRIQSPLIDRPTVYNLPEIASLAARSIDQHAGSLFLSSSLPEQMILSSKPDRPRTKFRYSRYFINTPPGRLHLICGSSRRGSFSFLYNLNLRDEMRGSFDKQKQQCPPATNLVPTELGFPPCKTVPKESPSVLVAFQPVSMSSLLWPRDEPLRRRWFT